MKLKTLPPRIKTLPPLIKPARPMRTGKTLKERQQETGRTLALDGAAWRKLRAVVLSEQPLCRRCERLNRLTPATDVDHIDNDAANNERRNLQGLCHECHSRKTAADMGRLVRYGCDTNGMPLDPAHPWSKSPATEDAKPTGKSSVCANREDRP